MGKWFRTEGWNGTSSNQFPQWGVELGTLCKAVCMELSQELPHPMAWRNWSTYLPTPPISYFWGSLTAHHSGLPNHGPSMSIGPKTSQVLKTTIAATTKTFQAGSFRFLEYPTLKGGCSEEVGTNSCLCEGHGPWINFICMCVYTSISNQVFSLFCVWKIWTKFLLFLVLISWHLNYDTNDDLNKYKANPFNVSHHQMYSHTFTWSSL